MPPNVGWHAAGGPHDHPGVATSDELLRILLVEDDLGDAVLVQAMLRRDSGQPFAVTVRETLADALAGDLGTFDVILTDLGLPDSEGLETVEAILERSGATPVIVLTGLYEDGLARRCVHAGATDYLRKDLLSSDVLWRAVRFGAGRLRSRS